MATLGDKKIISMPDGTDAVTRAAQLAVLAQIEAGLQHMVGMQTNASSSAYQTDAPFSAYVTGQAFVFVPVQDNIGACTLAVNSMAAKALCDSRGTAIADPDVLQAYHAYLLIYDATLESAAGGWRVYPIGVDLTRWAAHLDGAGGTDQHPEATDEDPGLMSAADKAKLDELDINNLPGYRISMLIGTNLSYGSGTGWVADWESSGSEKADVGYIYSPRGGIAYSNGKGNATTIRFKQKFRLAEAAALSFRVLHRDDSCRIYVEDADHVVTSVGGLSGDSETPATISSGTLAAGDYWLHIFINNSGGTEMDLSLKDWYTADVSFLVDEES